MAKRTRFSVNPFRPNKAKVAAFRNVNFLGLRLTAWHYHSTKAWRFYTADACGIREYGIQMGYLDLSVITEK